MMGHIGNDHLRALLINRSFVRSLATRLVRDAASVDDVVQEAIMAALHRPAGGIGGDGRPFAASVVRNVARDRARGELRRADRERAAAAEEALPDVTDALIVAERQRAVVDAVLALEEPYRSVVLLRWFEELPPREIVRRTGRSLEAVKKQLARGLEKLRAHFEERFGDGGAWAVALLPLTDTRAALGVGGGALLVKRAALVLALVGVAVVTAVALRPAGVASPSAHPDPGQALASVTEERVRPPAELPPRPDEASRSARSAADRGGAGMLAPPGTIPGLVQPRYNPPLQALLVDLEGRRFASRELREVALEFVFAPQPSELAGVPSVTWPTVSLPPDGDGWVSSDLVPPVPSKPIGELRVAHGDLAIVAHGFPGPTEDESRIVLTRSVEVGGRVVDANGAPVAEAEVDLITDLLALGTYPGDLRGLSSNPGYGVSTDSAGRFELGSVPHHQRFVVRARHAGRAVSVAVPEVDRDDLELRLPAPARVEVLEVRVHVLHSTGAPASRARVEVGWMRAEADDGGVATIEMRPCQLRSFAGQGALVAAISEDGRHAHTALDADFLGPYELRIPTRMERITGRLLDEIGAPLASVRACVDDPTQSGDGAPLEARGADPFTDAQGAFEITGLLDRPYTLRFTRQEPFLVHDVQDVRAGSEGLVVQIPSTAVRPLVEGLVLDAYGEPVAGVQVRPFVTTTTPAMVGAVVVGTGVKTDGEGRFTIARLPISVAAFFVDPFPNDERVSTRCEVPPGAFDGTLVLRPDFECDVVAGLREGMIGATLQFVDAVGAVLAVEEIATHRALRRSDVQQKPDGTFGRLRVTQRARAVRVLNANSELLRTVAIALAVTEQNRLEL